MFLSLFLPVLRLVGKDVNGRCEGESWRTVGRQANGRTEEEERERAPEHARQGRSIHTGRKPSS